MLPARRLLKHHDIPPLVGESVQRVAFFRDGLPSGCPSIWNRCTKYCRRRTLCNGVRANSLRLEAPQYDVRIPAASSSSGRYIMPSSVKLLPMPRMRSVSGRCGIG